MSSTDEIGETAIRRIRREIVEATGDPEPRSGSGFESAERVYRAVPSLRDLLPADTQQQLAVCFEWAREGIARQTDDNVAPDLEALHAAYAYVRDVMLESAKRRVPR